MDFGFQVLMEKIKEMFRTAHYMLSISALHIVVVTLCGIAGAT
jgi:hypothetical protein